MFSKLTLAAGNYNVHSLLRDEHKPADQRGETIGDWFTSRNAKILKYVVLTQVNRATRKLSTLGITTVNSTWVTSQAGRSVLF